MMNVLKRRQLAGGRHGANDNELIWLGITDLTDIPHNNIRADAAIRVLTFHPSDHK